MNTLAILFLAVLLLNAAIFLVAELAELRSLRNPLPADFRDVFDETAYRRSQDYAYARSRFSLFVFFFDLAVLLAFWLGGGFGWWDRVVRGLGWSDIPTGLVFVVGLVLARSLLSLPFQAYSSFKIEKDFGFNRTSPATFFGDIARGFLLTLVLGGLLLAGVIWLLSHTGWWPYVVLWLAAIVISGLLQYILPIWIMPLFNKFVPLETGEVRDAVIAYAKRTGYPIHGLYVVDGSRRSTKANAFFTGFGRNKRLALFDTLVARHSPEEIVAVVAHEVGHYRRHHTVIGMVAGFAELGIGIALLSVFLRRPSLFAAFGVQNVSVYAGLVLFAVLASPFESIVGVPLLALSRLHERQADSYAAQTSGPAAMARALKRLAADTLTHLTPARLYVWLNYSHPPLAERVRALSVDGRTTPT